MSRTTRPSHAWLLLGLVLAARIDACLAQPRFAAAAWGIHVVSLDSRHTLYAHDADRLVVPASDA